MVLRSRFLQIGSIETAEKAQLGRQVFAGNHDANWPIRFEVSLLILGPRHLVNIYHVFLICGDECLRRQQAITGKFIEAVSKCVSCQTADDAFAAINTNEANALPMKKWGVVHESQCAMNRGCLQYR